MVGHDQTCIVIDDFAPLLDRPAAAAALHVSERTVRRYGKSGLLDERRIGPRLIRITEESVMALLGRSTTIKDAMTN